jgi:hypothetical protein
MILTKHVTSRHRNKINSIFQTAEFYTPKKSQLTGFKHHFTDLPLLVFKNDSTFGSNHQIPFIQKDISS